MKKIVGMGAAVALAASMFAAEPVANPQVLEFKGNASVEWGVDLDTGKTGFKNTQEASIKAKLFDGGDKATSGSGVWAELKIVADTKDNEYKNELAGPVEIKAPKVDTAKIHFNNFYVGILKGDTQTGALKFTRAIKSGDNDNGKLLSDVGPKDYSQGIVAGYDDSNFGVAIDFRSLPVADNTETKDVNEFNQYTNDYAAAAEVTLKDSNEFLSGLEVKGGYSYEFADAPVMGYSGSVAYKAKVSGDYYLKPAFGYTGASLDGTATVNKIAGAVIFGWGDTADADAGVYFLENDAAKKVTPGVSVSYEKDLEDDMIAGKISAAVYLGSLVDNLKAAALCEMEMFDSDYDLDPAMVISAGIAYDIKAGDITITPKAGFTMSNVNALALSDFRFNEANAKDIVAGKVEAKDTLDDEEELKVKVGVDVAGLISNTTFYAFYESKNLKADENKIGTVNVGCKIAF